MQTKSLPIESHPLPPFLPPQARLLMLGSFPPPPSRWSMDFFYPNLQNDMWRILGLVFFGRKDYFLEDGLKGFSKERICAFLCQTGIALSDTAHQVIRHQQNASDKSLEIVQPVDLTALLAPMPHCQSCVTTGEKASEALAAIVGLPRPPAIGAFMYTTYANRELCVSRLPSSSRAYPMALEKKAEAYRAFFKEMKML